MKSILLYRIVSSSGFGAMAKAHNIAGPQIRKIRYGRGWSQEMLAARCSIRGLELSRSTVAKIEAQLRYVTDDELVIIAGALGVSVLALLPNKPGSKKVISA